MKKSLVVLTGAGISAESGLKTFRDSDGLWEEYRIEEVASIQGWMANPQLVIEFYNKRRRQLKDVVPNDAHKALSQLESEFDVKIITQNVDDLHERAGSSNVIHLHGELVKARSSDYPDLIYPIGYNDIFIGDRCEKGSQLRPHIVWFGEEVPLIEYGAQIVSKADYLLIIGTSLQVYPAAGLIHYAPSDCVIYLIDPKAESMPYFPDVKIIKGNAGDAVPVLVDELMAIKS